MKKWYLRVTNIEFNDVEISWDETSNHNELRGVLQRGDETSKPKQASYPKRKNASYQGKMGSGECV